MRICTECEQDLPATIVFFHRSKKGKHGLRSKCKRCSNTENRQYKEEHKEEMKQYYRENKDKNRQRGLRRENKYNCRYKHEKIRIRKEKTQYCTICNLPKKLDLCNINHTYTDNLNDWIYLCRGCHQILDNLLRSEEK